MQNGVHAWHTLKTGKTCPFIKLLLLMGHNIHYTSPMK